MRSNLAVTWTDLSLLLGVSRKYLFLLRAGARNIGPRLERKLREIEEQSARQDGNNAGIFRADAGTIREDAAGYMTEDERLLVTLARENAALKVRLAEMDEKMKRIEGRG